MTWRSSIEKQQRERVASGHWRQRQIVESSQGSRVTIAGKPYDNFCSNDYLGLASDARLIEAASKALERFGVGSGASHLVCGHQSPHHELEQSLASFMDAEKAVVFSTGYMANLAIAQALLKRGDYVFQDKLNHASLLDAGRYCEAKLKRFGHCDTDALEHLLGSHPDGRKMIAVDGVFSMDGNVAPLKEIAGLAEQFNALLVVDEAHSFGVLGQGRGAAAEANIRPRENVLVMGTLGKAMGSFGAFVAGDALFIEQLIQFGRTYIYTTALPPHVVATTLAAVEISACEPEKRNQLLNNVALFKKSLALKCQRSTKQISQRFLPSRTPIQPLLVGDSETAMNASLHLRQHGILVSAIRPPTVPPHSSRLRITLNACHSRDSIDRLAEIISGDEFQNLLDACPLATEAGK